MARITWAQSSASITWQKLRQVIGNLQTGRDLLFELNRDIVGFTDTQLGVELGCSTADATILRNRIIQGVGELGGTITTQLNVGNTSATATLVDELG